MDIGKIEEIRKNLNKFSFENVVIKKNGQDLKWCKDFANTTKNIGFCTLCEKSNCTNAQDFEGAQDYKLHFVSHGAHALDFCDSMGIKPDNTWNSIPVLFLFENPSIQYGDLYEDKEKGWKKEKYPAKKWYWIHEGYMDENFDYPKKYKQGCYGGLIASLIKTFKLANAYMTNIVKCSMNTNEGTKYLGTQYYKEECIKKCIKEVLKEEIKILTNNGNDKLIIFAFSKQVYNLAKENLGKLATEICLMPHPASRLSNDYRKYVIFGKVYKTLTNNGCKCCSALREFLDNDKKTKMKSITFDDGHVEELKEKFGNFTYNKKKFNTDGCAVIKIEKYKIECKFNISGERVGFGFDSLSEDGYWMWDYNEKKYLDNLESYNQGFTELYNAFCEFIESKENP